MLYEFQIHKRRDKHGGAFSHFPWMLGFQRRRYKEGRICCISRQPLKATPLREKNTPQETHTHKTVTHL